VRGIREWSSLPIVVLSARVDEQQEDWPHLMPVPTTT